MLEGEISQIELVSRLVELWREEFTGAIRFENDGIIKIIYFKGGDILSASTNDRADSIDEILMRANKVSREHVKQALARRKESETLGDAMLNLGYITRKELTWARRVQVVGVIRSIAAWSTGSFTIVADYLPKRDEGTLFPLPQVLVELIVTEQDRQKFDRAMSGGAAVFSRTPDFDEVFRRLGLNEDAEAIVAQVDGTRNAAEVASSSGRDAFNVYKLLQALATLGVLKEANKPQVTPELSLEDEFLTAGVADAADSWEDTPGPALATDNEPKFQFDETEAFQQPTLDLPIPEAVSSSTSAWDEPEDEIPPPLAETTMPSWDLPPPATAAPAPIPAVIPTPIPPPIPTGVDPKEPQWGFDEAQLEASRRATNPAPPMTRVTREPKVKQGGRYGFLVAILVIAVIAGAGYGGWRWWQQREAAATVAAAAATETTQPVPASNPAETGTLVPVADSAEATSTVATTETAPPVADTTTTTAAAPPATATTTPAPMTITPPPAPAAAEQPLPVVTPRTTGDRARLDEMARQNLANPRGNFTVQVQILCDPGNLQKAMSAGGEQVWFVPQTIGARSCYRVFYGRYATREEAQRALATVPASIRDASSAVKPVPGRQ
jgi:hypothetical protein